jgi:hypothetical protein
MESKDVSRGTQADEASGQLPGLEAQKEKIGRQILDLNNQDNKLSRQQDDITTQMLMRAGDQSALKAQSRELDHQQLSLSARMKEMWRKDSILSFRLALANKQTWLDVQSNESEIVALACDAQEALAGVLIGRGQSPQRDDGVAFDGKGNISFKDKIYRFALTEVPSKAAETK